MRTVIQTIAVSVFVLIFPSSVLMFAGPPAKSLPPAVVLVNQHGQEQLFDVDDLTFASFKRIIYEKAAPRDEDPSRRRVEVEERRIETRGLRMSDWSTIKFSKLRQIEITYPESGRVSLLRLTSNKGAVQEIAADRLHGADAPLPPRIAATIDGVVHEFRLILSDASRDKWPEERLARILLRRKAPPRKSGR